MSDINYDPADYNNGVPPEPGVVWNGDTWGWPTRGYNVPPLPGDTETLTVTPTGTPADTWPKRPDIKEWYVPGEKPFDPSTGNGWVPAVDGYGEERPAGIPAVVQAAINKVKGAPLKGGMSAVDIWKLKPAPEYPGKFNTVNPAFSWFPVRALTDTDISAMPVAPETVPVHTRILDNVHDGAQFVSAVFAGSMLYNLPVVKAQVTAGGNYYTIGRLPGIMSAFTFSFAVKGTPQDSRFFRDAANVSGDLREAGFTVGANTSDFIIWFPQGSGVEPLYFSMTMNMPAEPLQRRQEAENKARAEADRLRAEAEAKIRAEAEARAKAEAERKALFAKAGIQDTPVYTPEMVKAANAALSAGGSMALSRAPGMIQLSAAGVGTLPFNSGLAGWEASALWRGVDVLARIAPVASAVATVATVLTLVRAALDIPAAGEGSDRVPGRNIDMLAAQASLYTAMKTNIQPGMKTVDLPVRGYISYDGNGRQSVNLVRTGTGGVSATVPVLNAVRDKVTGLDKITVPAVAGAPSRTILINPVPVGPAAPLHTGSSTPVPVTPVHTGTDVKQADSIVTTTLPAADIPALQDFIYWQPDATGTGVEPIYVMLSDPLDSGKFTRKQLQRKYKHAIDFGITDTKINGETLAKFRDAIEAHLSDKDTFEKGTYRRDKGSKVYFNPKTMRAVIIRANGDFLSGWKIDPNEENGKIYLDTGVL